MQGKVEICGVNTAKLKVLSNEETIALLHSVEAELDGNRCYFAYPAVITGAETAEGEEPPAYGRGKPCLLLAQGGPERYVALCFVETDSLGRIRKLHLSGDGRYTFARTDLPGEE